MLLLSASYYLRCHIRLAAPKCVHTARRSIRTFCLPNRSTGNKMPSRCRLSSVTGNKYSMQGMHSLWFVSLNQALGSTPAIFLGCRRLVAAQIPEVCAAEAAWVEVLHNSSAAAAAPRPDPLGFSPAVAVAPCQERPPGRHCHQAWQRQGILVGM